MSVSVVGMHYNQSIIIIIINGFSVDQLHKKLSDFFSSFNKTPMWHQYEAV